MGKKLSANELQQHNDCLSKGKEEYVNSLVKKLEKQKSKLPQEDHPIINWGIGVVMSKLIEDQEINNEMSERQNYYTNGVFIQKRHWDSQTNENDVFIGGVDELRDMAVHACQDGIGVLDDYVEPFKDHLVKFCHASNQNLNAHKMLAYYKAQLQTDIESLSSSKVGYTQSLESLIDRL